MIMWWVFVSGSFLLGMWLLFVRFVWKDWDGAACFALGSLTALLAGFVWLICNLWWIIPPIK